MSNLAKSLKSKKWRPSQVKDTSLRLRVLSTLRENFARFLRFLKFSLSISWFSRSLGRQSVIGRSGAVLSLQVLEVNHGEGRRLTRRRSRSSFDEARLQRLGKQAGSLPFATNVFTPHI